MRQEWTGTARTVSAAKVLRSPRRPLSLQVGGLRERHSGWTVCLIEGDLHAIRVLEAYALVAPGSDYWRMD